MSLSVAIPPPPPRHVGAPPRESMTDAELLKLILNARVYDVAIETPLTFAKNLSAKLNNKIYLKREDLQPVFSFKCRGAFNKIVSLTSEERARGVICASAGNHAQGVALAGKTLGIRAIIVMPKGTPAIKVNGVLMHGGEVILHGNDFDEAKAECLRLAKEGNFTFIPPFDDPLVIAGQGTCGVEILKQIKHDRLDGVFAPVGGGGLLAGVAAYIKQVKPDVRLMGVNTVDSDGMAQSLSSGQRVELPVVGLFSDGTAVRAVGTENYRVCKRFVDDVVKCTNDEICAAIKDVFNDTRSILEPAGALSVAGLKRYLASNPHIKDSVFVAITSGANMNFDRLRFVADRARIGEGCEGLIVASIPERRGSFFSNLYSVVYPRNITEISYRSSNQDKAYVCIGFEVTQGRAEVQEVVQQLEQKQSIKALDITENEMAKTHIRFLGGGRALIKNEHLVRFTFPERPGALGDFLRKIPKEWSITLIHYRNQGGDVGRVLMGFQLEDGDEGRLSTFLETIKLPYVDETNNEVNDFFLRSKL